MEANPHVGWYLERTLRENGLRVEVARKALTERAGAIDIMIDRTWSGLSGVAGDSEAQSRHRLEPIRVNPRHFLALIGEGLNERDRRLLVKVDVEGHEVSVLRGLEGIEQRFGSFAALIEITQIAGDGHCVETWTIQIELLENSNKALVRVAAARPAGVVAAAIDGYYHANDIVLRADA